MEDKEILNEIYELDLENEDYREDYIDDDPYCGCYLDGYERAWSCSSFEEDALAELEDDDIEEFQDIDIKEDKDDLKEEVKEEFKEEPKKTSKKSSQRKKVKTSRTKTSLTEQRIEKYNMKKVRVPFSFVNYEVWSLDGWISLKMLCMELCISHHKVIKSLKNTGLIKKQLVLCYNRSDAPIRKSWSIKIENLIAIVILIYFINTKQRYKIRQDWKAEILAAFKQASLSSSIFDLIKDYSILYQVSI